MFPLLAFQLYSSLILLGYSNAANDGCDIAAINETSWDVFLTLIIDDTRVQQAIFTSEYKGNMVLKNCTDEYFQMHLTDTHFTIETTEQFENFDLETMKQVESSKRITIFNCVIECLGDSNLWLDIYVNDTNNHPPTFKNLESEYKVSSSIMPGKNFTVDDTVIIVEDIDFSNQNVTLSIEPDDFDITTQSSWDSKEYVVIFSAKKIIQIDGSRQYVVTATDSGSNPGVLKTTQAFTLIEDVTAYSEEKTRN